MRVASVLACREPKGNLYVLTACSCVPMNPNEMSSASSEIKLVHKISV